MDKFALRAEEKKVLKTKLENQNITDCVEAFLGIVKDRKKGTIFYEYEDKSRIAERIYAELLDKYKEGEGFILSDDIEKVGVLSQAQGVSSLDTLIDKMNLFKSLSKTEASHLKEIYEKTIHDIIARVQDNDGYFLFNATPFDLNVFNKDYAFTETVTWIVSALLGALQLNGNTYEIKKGQPVKIEFNEEEVDKALEIVSWCLKYLTDSFIDEKEERKRLSKGWNFTSNCREPSLYFTYAVSECYMDVYETFKDIIDWRSISEKINTIKGKINEYKYSTDTDAEDWYWLYISPDDRDTYEEIKRKTASQEYKNTERLFNSINADNRYFTLDSQVKKAAENIWNLVGEKIDSNYFNYNLSSVITQEAIESSSTSDALFNTIFVISTVISGGLDEDIKDQIAAATDDNQIEKLQGDYDNLLETLQSALQRTIRYNKFLRSKRKDYIVNDFIISCSETFYGDTISKAQELRKKRIKAFTLSPLLMKTNNLISEYLTQYPQIDMVKYLDELLMRKRTRIGNNSEDSQYIWIWENGEYLVTSNYFYILSLSSFYDYTETYEDRFNKVDIENEKVKDQLILAHDQESRNSGEIFYLQNAKEKLEKDNTELERQISELKNSGVESELRKFLQQELKTNLIQVLTNSFREMNDVVLRDLMKDDCNSVHDGQISFLKELRRTFIVSFYEIIRSRMQYFGVENTDAAIKTIAKQLQSNTSEMIKEQVKKIIEDPNFENLIKGEQNV